MYNWKRAVGNILFFAIVPFVTLVIMLGLLFALVYAVAYVLAFISSLGTWAILGAVVALLICLGGYIGFVLTKEFPEMNAWKFRREEG